MRFSYILSAIALATSVSAQQQACNGYSALCTKPYNQLVSACTHNAYAFSPPGGIATNQVNDIPTQLNDGIRAFMLDAYNLPSGDTTDIQLCHTACTLLDGGPLSKTLGHIKAFMDKNPNEVITILWENSQDLAPARFQAVYAAAGLVAYSHAQKPGTAAWPTLSQMISSGKRLVSFIDSGAAASVPWLMAEYDFVFETPYNIVTGAPYPCTIDRPKDQKKPMYVLNHFVSGQFQLGANTISIPQPKIANVTNAAELADHVSNCQKVLKQTPNFIAVDFYEKGDLMKVVAQANGVKWNGKNSTDPSPESGSGTGSGSGTKNSAVSSYLMNAKALGMAVVMAVGLAAL
ncbi:hypothetical protein BGZ93_006350 [Podila epicladia]|nr:hypothetical protein BGZ92_010654 [Podila epicladia]KAG0099689.1 hypothetical protein BGZ93_006350 [Podila epicladia]